MKADQINIVALAVLGCFQEVDHAVEARLARQLRGDIRETDRLDRVHFDLTLFHRIADADRDARPHPYSDAARNLSAPNSAAQTPGEEHAVNSPGVAIRC